VDRAAQGLLPRLERLMATTVTSATARLAELLARPRYELLPLDPVVEQVAAHVPRDVKLTVTASPRRGIDRTIDVAERLAENGYEVVPHVSARLVADRGHLEEIVARLAEIGVRDVFVVAGDAEHPAGAFAGAAPLLEAMAELGHPFADVGITGYPESHPLISDETTIQAMFDKARFATYIVSQICFDSRVTVAWMNEVWRRGTPLPIHVGIPGAVPRAKLVRISGRIGLGESVRFLRGHSSWATRILRPAGFSPDPLIDGLEPVLADPEPKLAGFHVFTFNDLVDTERWRRARLQRLASTVSATS
jgi:methylenetetrahydrofolate reductase (NADPH)